ncbi:hypothetical protein EDC01DRAFT_120934 [Geopyxis carbonaria]|nr:hypothetical protein EDC01DRAFT_120934 [Geopyxis carbonaria]
MYSSGRVIHGLTLWASFCDITSAQRPVSLQQCTYSSMPCHAIPLRRRHWVHSDAFADLSHACSGEEGLSVQRLAVFPPGSCKLQTVFIDAGGTVYPTQKSSLLTHLVGKNMITLPACVCKQNFYGDYRR